MSGFYILVVRTETPKTLRGDVFTNHHQTKPLERFIIQKDTLGKVQCGKYGGIYSLKTYIIADTDAEATIKAKELFAGFLTEEAQKLRCWYGALFTTRLDDYAEKPSG